MDDLWPPVHITILVIGAVWFVWAMSGEGWQRRFLSIIIMFGVASFFIYIDAAQNGYVVGASAISAAIAVNFLLDRFSDWRRRKTVDRGFDRE